MVFASSPKMGGLGKRLGPALALLAFLSLAGPVVAAGGKILPGHVPAALNRLTAIGTLPATNQLDLAIGLPLRHPAELSAFIERLYDPASPDYRHYLTPEQFTARFGPTEGDYEQVKAFARQNNLSIRTTHDNRMVLDVRGAVGDIENALHVHMKVYHHPTEARDFYATDVNPSVDGDMPIADVSGLNNFYLPKPRLKTLSAQEMRATPRTGSGPAGSFIGNDFRAAYLPGVTLTGTGQIVGLVEFSGYYANDITAYEAKAGLSAVPLSNVPVDSYGALPTTNGNVEAALDIEMTVSMAPGISKIITFDAGPTGNQNDVLEAMVGYPTILQFSCSWGWGGGPTTTTDNLFEQMVSQGQSFFNASGDSDAFTVGSTSVNGVDNVDNGNAPSSNPYITLVGGTTLVTTGPGGAWSSENVWNWGSVSVGPGQTEYVGSSGGISSYYSIPSWQTSVSMAANGGSTSYRNIPDVAANANNACIVGNNGSSLTNEGGTSFAAPLWAGLAALMNEQAANAGRPAIGFINPVLYELGRGASYTTVFHDITTGNNESSASPSSYTAVTGYDLCTGWGTPAGQALINAVSTFEPLTVSQTGSFSASGYGGGPFTPASGVLALNNTGSTVHWSASSLPSWLTASPASGTLSGGASTTVSIALNPNANSLAVGSYAGTVTITDATTGNGTNFSFSVQVINGLAILNNNGFTASGPVGGPFALTPATVTLTNSGATVLNWNAGSHPAWLTVTPTNGTLSAKSTSVLSLGVSASAKTNAGGVYAGSLIFNNVSGQATVPLATALQVGQTIVQNGGFETGTFTNWTVVGTPNTVSLTYNGIYSTSSAFPNVVHSGSYGAYLGDVQLATVSQNLATLPGQNYLISLWLDNPESGAGEQFSVSWITNSATTSRIYFVTNTPVLAWTNLTFIVPATGTNTELQIGAENVPDYYGLDDISVTPVPNPAISSVTRAGTTLSLTLYTTIGVQYQLQYATNLAQGTWTPLSTNTATATTLTFTNSPSAGHPGFYRIRQLP